jgi:hypothetical protein
MVGIVVGGVLSAAGLLGAISALANLGAPSQNTIIQSVPELAAVRLLSAATLSVANGTVLIGVLLALARVRAGPRVVRIACVITLLASVGLAALRWAVVVGSPAFTTFDPPLAYGFKGAVIGSVVGSVVQWGFIYYLFRRSRYP